MNSEPIIDDFLARILEHAIELNASDVHIAPGEQIYFRIQGELGRENLPTAETQSLITAAQTIEFAKSLLDSKSFEQLQQHGSFDGAMTLNGESRFRFNAFLRGGETCFSFRRLENVVPSLNELGLTNRLYDICNRKDGLVLVAGPTGSGKSTTLASFIHRINTDRSCHIITIEDPVEYLHKSKKSLVSQRQVGRDVESFETALKDALRQDPDVILVGELRDSATIEIAVQAGMTGHLVFGSVHAGDCKSVIERIVGSYSSDEQELGQRMVANVLKTVIVQHLLPSITNPNVKDDPPKRVLASEVMHVNSAIANLVATANLKQIGSMIETSGDEGMWTLDASLARLWRSRLISEKTARSLARNSTMLTELFKRAGRA